MGRGFPPHFVFFFFIAVKALEFEKSKRGRIRFCQVFACRILHFSAILCPFFDATFSVLSCSSPRSSMKRAVSADFGLHFGNNPTSLYWLHLETLDWRTVQLSPKSRFDCTPGGSEKLLSTLVRRGQFKEYPFSLDMMSSLTSTWLEDPFQCPEDLSLFYSGTPLSSAPPMHYLSCLLSSWQ